MSLPARVPAYCSASCLAIVVTFADGEIDDILIRSNLVRNTATTMYQPRNIKDGIAGARQRGYARTKDEYFVSDIATAAAVTEPQGRNRSGEYCGSALMLASGTR